MATEGRSIDPSPLIWRKVIWREWRREPGIPLVLILILALGVAVFLSVRLANRAAVTGFSLFTDSLSGDSDLLVRPKAGSFEESLLEGLREAMDSVPASIFPVLDTTASSGTEVDSMIYRIIGTDFVALPNAVYLGDQGSSPFETGSIEVLGREDQAFISEALARNRKLENGDQLTVYLEGREKSVVIAGVLKNDPLRAEIPLNLLVMDLPGAQKLSGNEGGISRLEIRIPPGPDFEINLEEAKRRLLLWSGDTFVVETPGQRKESATQMSAAFRLNLTILSTLALIVGAYLILQAMEAAVIKRRAEIAVLRCLGVTPRQIQKAWLTESIVLGGIGSLVGIGLGYLLAQAMVRGISSTVNTLYYETTSQSAGFDAGEISIALLFGIGVSIVAGWLPAREAAQVPPALSVAKGTRGGGLKWLRNPVPGYILLVVAALLVFLPPWTDQNGSVIPLAGYISALFFLIGTSMITGRLFTLVSRLLAVGRESPQRCYAASQFRLPEGRHRLAAAGLLAAFGMSAAMGILVSSFETTLNAWIRQVLKADIYIAAPGGQSVTSDNKISESVWSSFLKTPGIAGVDRLRRYPISFQGQETWLAGSDYNENGRYLQLIWVDEPEDQSANALRNKNGDRYPAWISESFGRRFQVKKGSRITIPTARSAQPVVIKGVYADYGSERGTILLSRDYTSEWFSDNALNNLAIYLEPEVNEERWLAEFQTNYPGIVARTNRKLRDEALRVFSDTFRVTYALEGIAIFIAVAGLGLAMTGLLLERRDELGTLKELGLSRLEIAKATMWEGVGLSFVGLLGGMVLALFLGWLLVYVINRQSFGWTLNFSIPWGLILCLMTVLLVTGGLVAGVVGYRVANLKSDKEIE